MTRVLRGLGSLVTLVLLVAGAPLLLLRTGRLGGITGLDWDALVRVPDTGAFLLAVITLVGWVAWAVVLASVLAELARLVSRGRVRIRIPGAGWAQSVVAVLVAAVAAMVVPPVSAAAQQAERPAPITASAHPHAPASPFARPEAPVPSAAPDGSVPNRTAQTPAPETPPGPQLRTHRVVAGDDLWSIAEEHYGDGTRWRQIAAENQISDVTRLEVGAELRLPGLAVAKPGTDKTEPAGPREHVVAPGESLSQIAADELGDRERWPEIQQLNESAVTDPDVVQPGWRLTLPDAPCRDRQPPDPTEQAGDRAGAAASQPTSSQPTSQQSRPSQSDGSSRPSQPDGSSRPSQSGEPSRSSEPSQSPGAVQGPTRPAQPSRASLAPTQAPELEATSQTLDVLGDPSRAVLGGMGVLLAAAISSALVARRREQLGGRGLGRRITLPDREGLRLESAMARAASTVQEAPVEACPTSVLLGETDNGEPVLYDLEAVRSTAVLGDPEGVAGLLAATTTGLALQPWSAESRLVLVGELPWMSLLDHPQLTHLPDAEQGLTHLERSLAARRVALGRARFEVEARDGNVDLERLRQDPDRWEAWAPQVHVFAEALDEQQWRRITAGLDGAAVGISVLAAARTVPRCGEIIEVTAQPSGEEPAPDQGVHDQGTPGEDAQDEVPATPPVARLCSTGETFTAHQLQTRVRRALVGLLQASSGDEDLPAPWWADDLPPTITPIDQHSAVHELDEETPVAPTGEDHPILKLLGPIELDGAQGPEPTRARRQCIEYAAWIHCNPCGTATMMARQLLVAEGTRRSNMSRLRTWLGTDANGEPYLPDAYSGRIQLHPGVSTDWERVQLLVGRGVNHTDTGTLTEVLRMVRGAPLADAAPGQWHWAEELRCDMASVVRDVGVVLAERALQAGDVDLARWAASRALVVAPSDEMLLRARIRTEHRAGNRLEVERLVMQATRAARAQGVDLDDQTVMLVQEVMEGRQRARGA
ncbi:LysM peptidoglycan-binding domain-containing protein [Luteococcus sp.]|uniref:LysM peptidoglycan-binding domain-containing protein n=1 Tax=Luteococcus sp. TaxID=1969402 RepID=UPI003735018C